MKRWVLIIALVGAFPTLGSSQECVGGQVSTLDTFLYGRFETAMRSVGESGVVSSFFLYNLGVECNWPEENNEIDIEMTGDDENVQFTTHYPNLFSHSDIYTPSFNPHDSIHDYAIEWEPGVVRWFIDGELVNVQDQPFVEGLIYPMNLMMNLWAANAVGWVGPWDPSVMPQESIYEYVKVYDYTPGSGDYGTNDNFSLRWSDNFLSLDSTKWDVTRNGGFNGNYCTFKPLGVSVNDGRLHLKIQEPPIPDLIPVTFSVNTSDFALSQSDAVNLNGSFNEWCGDCEPMERMGDLWSVTIDLEPGRYEYLFVKNLWEETGSAPMGSSCDFLPCDEWLNYGFDLLEGSGPVTLKTYCWGECTDCSILAISDEPHDQAEVIRYLDLWGQEVPLSFNRLLIVQYSDGTYSKVVVRE